MQAKVIRHTGEIYLWKKPYVRRRDGFSPKWVILLLTSYLDRSKLQRMDLSQPEPFRRQIADAQSSLQTLWTIRRLVDQKMDDLRALIRANANFLPDAERCAELMALEMFRIPANIAEAVKLVLFVARPRSERLTPVQIKERAEERGFDFTTYSNPMASIHTILKRMKDSDPPEVEYDETTGTYMSLKFPGSDMADPAFHEQIGRRVFHRLWAEEREKAQVLVGDEIDRFLQSLTNRQQQQRQLNF